MRRLPTLLLLLVATSCSGKKDSTADDALATVTGFCAEWANRACNPTVLDKCIASVDQCTASQSAFCETLIPKDKYSSATASACLDAVQGAYASATLTPADRDLVTSLTGACSKIISGSAGKDGACSADSDCNRDVDLACVKKAGSSDGKCEKPVPVGNGESCSASDSVCGDGFYCDEHSHCVSGGGDGEACSAAIPCGSSFRCVSGAGAADGGAADGGGASAASATCVALKKTTESCTANDECVTGICVINVSKGNGKCADKIVLSGSDSSCAKLQ